ncbi:CinA family protein [Synergistes jonesii]|uniref:CinA family protein n=1 Tax=Synergistes jonesii TaxID=2754 RepID=UPI00331DEBAB
MTDRIKALAVEVIEAFRSRGISLSLAESCTGGMIAAAVTEIAGASDIFSGSAVTYVNEAKENILGVCPETLAEHGAVSEKCAREMAEGSRRIFGSDIALSVTGIAGPGGGSTAKPVGTVWFGCASAAGTEAFVCHFGGGRRDVRRQSVERALSHLLKACGESGVK